MNDTAEELLKVTDVWSYFDTDSSRRAKCIVCKTNVGNEYEELKAHLKDNHPKLLLQILQDKDQNSDAASNDGDDADDNTYTEVVYLEQEPPTENVIKIKDISSSYSKPKVKRERLHSLPSSDEIPTKKLKEDNNDELEAFIKYITCLLKKLPSDVFSNVQAEIITTILKASSQVNSSLANTSIVLGKELVKTSSNIITVDGLSSMNNTLRQDYTITVEQPVATDSDVEKT